MPSFSALFELDQDEVMVIGLAVTYFGADIMEGKLDDELIDEEREAIVRRCQSIAVSMQVAYNGIENRNNAGMN